jgi:hypothetical protein
MTESILKQMYRADRAQQSGSLIYQVVPKQPTPRSIYAGSQQYQGLSGYQNRPEPVDTRSEIAKAYTAEHSPWERAARQAAEADEAEARAQAQQAAFDVLQGRGLNNTHGMFTAADRQAHRIAATQTRDNGAAIERLGGMATSIAPVPGRVYLSQIEQANPMPVRPAVPLGSSGSDWLGVHRG